MLDKQWQFVGRQITDSATTANDSSNGCIQNRLGSFCQWFENRSRLEQYGKDATHQHSGTYSNLFGQIDFHKSNKKGISSPPDRHICPDISSENGVNTDLRNNKNFRGKLNVFVERKHLYNRGVSTQQMEFCSRPGVSAKNGFLRMEAESKDLSKMSQSSNTKNWQNPATSEAKFRNRVG